VKISLSAFALAGAMLMSTAVAMAADYIQSPPLNQVVNSSVNDCRTQTNLNVPVIAWGGDIPTLVSNGNSLTTQDGSWFDIVGLDVTLSRQDRFATQVENYLSCDTPFLRGTQGMINMAADLTQGDPRTEMVAIYQLSWSNGGDALVVNSDIASLEDLKGKTIVLQAYGPHIEYLTTLLDTAGLNINDVNIKWVQDLTGTDNTPYAAFINDENIDAAFMIIPDALVATSDGTTGTGAEGSRHGATIMVSTKTANRLISDVYVVRRDYFDANRDQVQQFVHALMLGEEATREAIRLGQADATAIFSAAAEHLLDAPGDVVGAQGLWADAETVGYRGNVAWVNQGTQRSWLSVNNSIQSSFGRLGLMSSAYTLSHAAWDYTSFEEGLSDTSGVEQPRFNEAEVQAAVTDMSRNGTLDDAGLYEFQIFFEPNQSTFPSMTYSRDFEKVIELAATYGGAVITVEGHSDPLEYLRKRQSGESNIMLNRMIQSGNNLSMVRAQEVVTSIISFASANGVQMDQSQFVPLGLGFSDPTTGLCENNTVPCAPQTEAEWKSNMRVVFRIVSMEAEAQVFTPLN